MRGNAATALNQVPTEEGQGSLATAATEMAAALDDEPEPEPEDYDPRPEVDDEGGMSEYATSCPRTTSGVP